MSDQIGNGIPWAEAKKFAEAHGQTEIIIVCSDGKMTDVLSWGKTPGESANAATGSNRVKDLCWPDDKPHTQCPAWLSALIEIWEAAQVLDMDRTPKNIHNIIRLVKEHRKLIATKIKGRMNAIELTKEQSSILDHTIHRAAGGYYCGGGNDMDALVAAGLMVSAGRKSFVPDEYFRITGKGREALREYNAKPKPDPATGKLKCDQCGQATDNIGSCDACAEKGEA